MKMKHIIYFIFICGLFLWTCTSDIRSNVLSSPSEGNEIFKNIIADTFSRSATIIERLIKATPKDLIGQGEVDDEVCNFSFSYLGKVLIHSKVA